ncbi:hypothetical protein C0J52_00015 [Blattella germanica]|nr:hypothetical protein C0J52_00015 [Blattella germanica]
MTKKPDVAAAQERLEQQHEAVALERGEARRGVAAQPLADDALQHQRRQQQTVPVPVQTKDRRGRRQRHGHDGRGALLEAAAHEPGQAQGHRHHLRAAVGLRHGGDGRAADQRAHQRARVALRHVLRVHHGARGRAHLRPHDQHVPAAQHRRRQQTASAPTRQPVAPRAHARIHRARVGLLHGARALPLLGGSGHPLLGQVLGLLLHGSVGRHHHRHPGARRVRGVRGALLPQPRGLQVRVHGHRSQTTRGHEEAVGLQSCVTTVP